MLLKCKKFLCCLYSFAVVQVQATFWADQRTDTISEGKNHASKSSYYFLLILVVRCCNSDSISCARPLF